MDLNVGRCTVKTHTFRCVCPINKILTNRIGEFKLVPLLVQEKGWCPGSMSVNMISGCEMNEITPIGGCCLVLQSQSKGDDPFG